MSQDHDPLEETLRFQPIDPYNIGPDTAGAPQAGYEPHEPEVAPRPRPGFKERLGRLGPARLIALGTGLAILVGGVAWGATALAGSGGSGVAGTQAQGQSQNPLQNPADGGPTGGRAAKKDKAAGKAARVTITSLGAGTFTGTEARGKTVTVVYDGSTRFGTKARPLSADQLQVGMTVTVAGSGDGDKITALLIAVPARKAAGPRSDSSPEPSATVVE
jgi:hypothetical protein